MAHDESPPSDASSDLYAEVDTSSHFNLASRLHNQAAASSASDNLYAQSPVHAPGNPKGKRRFAHEDFQAKDHYYHHMKRHQNKKQKIALTPETYFSSAVPALANLPAEVWQNVFLHLTPDDLARCLRVNSLLRFYLTELTASMSIRLPPHRNGLKLLDSDSVWASARKRFAPNLLRPLAGFTEMQMLQLLGGRDCQACGVMPSQQAKPTSAFDAGPGPDGVRIIWSFSARLCGPCLQLYSVKDIDVVVSPVNPLRAGLPYAFYTSDLHYIPPTLQQQAVASSTATMFKVYSQKHIEDLQQEHENAKEYGDAAAEEWIKGLSLLGKQQMADAARWERWEAQLPLGADIGVVLRKYFRPPRKVRSEGEAQNAAVAAAPAVIDASASTSVHPTSLPAPPSTKMKHPLPARVVAAPTSAQPINGTTSPEQSAKKDLRYPRSVQEIAEAKALRKAEIERRCYHEFQPPLMPNVLQHMESFHAATQITTSLTDSAWEVLKPRLYAQRDDAEQIEYMREEQLRALQATIPDPSYHAMHNPSLEATIAAGRQYKEAQRPIRKGLTALADEFIREKWKNCSFLTHDNSPEFAVDVLLYARNTFVARRKPANLPPDRYAEESDPWFVGLENMRWLFDKKIKPKLNDKYMREPFHCSECKSAGRTYGFEGLIQHYGAKHTTDFSRGNVVVHWPSAEWPEEPPFQACNGVPADPTLPEQSNAKRQKTVNVKQNNAVTDIATSAPSLPQGGADYGHGAPWPPKAAEHAAYPQNTQPGYASYDHPQVQAGAPVDPYYQQGYYPVNSGPPPQNPQYLYEAQVDRVAEVAQNVWDTMGGIKGMEESVRVQTMLHHVVVGFKAHYDHEPTLDMLADALARHPKMQNVKDASGMACKTCISSRLDGYLAFQPYATRIADSKLYNMSSLVSHFKTVHLQSNDDAGLDWKEDMIELPEDANIRELLIAVGMNDEKLATIAQVFPKLFPNPLPKIGEVKETLQRDLRKEAKERAKAERKKAKKQKRTSGHRPARAPQADFSESDAPPQAADDEYDPRRPAFIESGNQGKNKNGKRPLGDSQRQLPSVDLTQLAPETLKALSILRPEDAKVQEALAGRVERSPSVPRVTDYGQASAAFQNNPQPAHPREANARSSGRHDRGVKEEPAEDYTQIIRTPASGPYNQHTLANPAPPQDQHVRFDAHGQPVEYPRHGSMPYGYEYDNRVGHQDYYPHPEYRMEHAPPVPYGYGTRPETVYVDQYGRPVEVVRVIERQPLPMYDYQPHQHDYYQRENPHARYVYYGQPPPHAPQPGVRPGHVGPPPRVEYEQAPGGAPRYVYDDDGRASVPRK